MRKVGGGVGGFVGRPFSAFPETLRWTEVRFYSFQVVIEKEPVNEAYYAYSPTFPGYFSNGKTLEEARLNMRQAIEQHVESLRANARRCDT
jgi:predicted RNase H-like HicB family nuclease